MTPPNFPTDGLLKSLHDYKSGKMEFHIKPSRITFQSLKTARNIAFNNVSMPHRDQNNWSKANCEAFLSSQCINKKFRTNATTRPPKPTNQISF